MLAGGASSSSLRSQVDGIFGDVLDLELSPGAHAGHFRPANVASSAQIISALTSFISANASSVPLSSTVAGVSFDFSSGVPVRQTTGLGPIFAETGSTMGRGRVIFGYNFTFMRLDQLRGRDLGELQFSFTHQDVGTPGMGDSDNEFDTVDLFMDMSLDVSILAFYTTVGITNWLDAGIAIPFVNLRLEANSFSQINSFTFITLGTANHFYGGTTTNPVLTKTPEQVDDDATGMGDISFRAKAKLASSERGDIAALVDIRVPTGDDENFLGAGNAAYKLVMIASRTTESLSPHANLAYELKTNDLDSDEIELFAGFDQKISDKLTVAVDFLGEFEVEDTASELQFDQTVTISRPHSGGTLVQNVDLSNVPSRSRDHNINGSVGFKYAPKDYAMLIGNVIVPLNDGGVRPNFITTLGFEFNF
jgi:hypothetical protein